MELKEGKANYIAKATAHFDTPEIRKEAEEAFDSANDDHKEMAVVCVHIVNFLKARKKCKAEEFDKDAFACLKCLKRLPSTEKGWLKNFVTACRICIKPAIK